ncbi:MAG: hypothetical protein HYR56_02325 [Acidobacteria bacterium]|nr:hypothetical protein [Acidobacteriota bacterium]MBI3421347.1 hypothetical protein [Acidobacteriota bacterium]
MNEPIKAESGEQLFPFTLEQAEAVGLGEFLRAANTELAGILQRIAASREESARLAAQSEEVMSKLRKDWLC